MGQCELIYLFLFPPLAERRTTKKTEVILPSSVQRRAVRTLNAPRNVSGARNGRSVPSSSSSPAVREAKLTFKPRNMSYPSPPAGGASGSRPGGSSSSSSQRSGGMMDKLKKQFLKGR